MESWKPDYHTFILEGNRKIGVLLVHGFLSFPGEMKRLAIKLKENGFTSLCVQLPGHYPPDNVDMQLYSYEESILAADFIPGYVRYLAKGILLFSIYHKEADTSK